MRYSAPEATATRPAGLAAELKRPGAALGAAFVLLKRNLWALVPAHAYLDTLLLVSRYRG